MTMFYLAELTRRLPDSLICVILRVSNPHRFTGQRSKCTIQPFWSSSSLKLWFIFFWSQFQILSIFFIDWFHWKFFLIVFKESSKLEVVFSVEVWLYCHVILNEFEELLLELIDLFSYEEWVDEREICVGKIAIVPYFLSDKKRAQEQWPPVGWLQRHFCECY